MCRYTLLPLLCRSDHPLVSPLSSSLTLVSALTQLRRLLLAYAAWDKELEYVQGMSYLGAMVTLVGLDEYVQCVLRACEAAPR